MATKGNHSREPLPNRDQIFPATLDWAMGRKGGYTGYDVKAHLIGHLRLTEEQMAETNEGGANRFGNLVDWVTAEFTMTGIHTGWDGERHKSSGHLYFLTAYGYAVGEGRVEKPKGNRHGPRNAKPDIRQLTEEQQRIAPWLKKNGSEPSDLDKVIGVLAARQTKP